MLRQIGRVTEIACVLLAKSSTALLILLSAGLFGILYRKPVWTQVRLLYKEHSLLGQYCFHAKPS